MTKRNRKTYPLADLLTWADLCSISHAMGVTGTKLVRMRYKEHIRAISRGAKWAPRQGEWYLSGNPVEAYRAPNDIGQVFPMARFVWVESIETITKFL